MGARHVSGADCIVRGRPPGWPSAGGPTRASVRGRGRPPYNCLLPLLAAVALAAPAATRERAIGEKLARAAERTFERSGDAALEQYLERIADDLARHCAPQIRVEARAVVRDEPNAFALVGGYVYLTMGLIRQTASEAGLAGVLAHLMAYLNDNHRGISSGLELGDPVMRARLGGWGGYNYRPGPGAPFQPQPVSRAAVLRADARAVACLAEAGYDPAAFIDDLKQLEPEGLKQLPSPGYPPVLERIEGARRAVAKLPPRAAYKLDNKEFIDLERRLAGAR